MRSTEERAYRAGDVDALQRLVETLDVDLPERSDPDWKERAEQYLMARVLHALDRQELAFPLELVHSDRPDFHLTTAGRVIGIELVEAASNNDRRKNELRSSETELSMWFVEPGIPGEPRKPAEVIRDELRVEMQADLAGEVLGDGSVGPPWPEWGRAMAHVISAKVVVATRPGFRRFEENWLAIYDNWPMVMTTPKPDQMSEALRLELSGSICFDVFDRIFIVSNRLAFEFTESKWRIVDELDRTPPLNWRQQVGLWLWGLYERYLLWRSR